MITTVPEYRDYEYMKLSGYITLSSGSQIELDDDNIIEQSTAVKENCCNNQFGFGAMISSQLDLAVMLYSNNPYLLDDAQVCLKAEYYDSGGEHIQDILLGSYRVDNSSVKRTPGTVSFTAYDDSIKLDALITEDPPFASGGESVYPWQMLKYACEKCGIELLQTDKELSTLFPNGQPPESETYCWRHTLSEGLTYRQMVCAALQLMGAFGIIDRQTGRFKVRQFDMSRELFTIDEDSAVSRTISDKPVTVTGVSAEGFLMGEEGYVYDLTGNLIVMRFSKGEQTLMHGRPLYELNQSSGIVGITAYSADISWFGDPAVEAGDCFLYKQEGLYGGDRKLIAMETIWKPHGLCTIRSFGADDSSGHVSAPASQSSAVSSSGGGASGGSSANLGYVSNVMLGGLSFVYMNALEYSAATHDPTTVYFVTAVDGRSMTIYLGDIPHDKGGGERIVTGIGIGIATSNGLTASTIGIGRDVTDE